MCCGLWTLCHTIQHRAVLIIFPLNLQTITITRMLSCGGEGDRHQTPPRYRHATRGSRFEVQSPLFAIRPLRPNVTSSIKPEVHNVWQRRQRMMESRPQGVSAQNFVTIGPAVRAICSRTHRHTERHTHTQTGWSQYTALLTRRSNKCYIRPISTLCCKWVGSTRRP